MAGRTRNTDHSENSGVTTDLAGSKTGIAGNTGMESNTSNAVATDRYGFSNNSSVKGGWSITDVDHRLSSKEVSGTTLMDRLQGTDITGESELTTDSGANEEKGMSDLSDSFRNTGGMNSFRDIGSSSVIASGTSDAKKSK